MLVTVELYNKALDEISIINQQLKQNDIQIAGMREALSNTIFWAGTEYVPVDSAEDYERDMGRAKDALANVSDDRVLVDREKIEASLETLEGAVIDYSNGDLGINRAFQINIVCVRLAALLKEKQC